MSIPTTSAQRRIIEELYAEAMVLADEARDLFDQRRAVSLPQDTLAFSIEGLRTTTRLMNVLAWLLNRRAYLDGELTERQLARTGGLPAERPATPGLPELPAIMRALVADSERLRERVARLDTDWRSPASEGDAAALQSRLAGAFTA